MPLFRRKSAEKFPQGDEEASSPKSAADDDGGTEQGFLGRLRGRSSSRERKHHHRDQPDHLASVAALEQGRREGEAQQRPSIGIHGEGARHQHEQQQHERRHSSSAGRERSSSGGKRGGGSGDLTVEAAKDAGEVGKGVEGKKEKKLEGALTREDVRMLFDGAPHFTLEPGRRGRSFPQAFFPFASHLDLTDLEDRQYLRHEAFALFTLHSHLPIPAEISGSRPAGPASLSNTTSSSSSTDPQPTEAETLTAAHHTPPTLTRDTHHATLTPSTSLTTTRTTSSTSTSTSTSPMAKRPMFDLSIYERPNMLSLQGRLRGTLGMRAFLERDVADGLHGVDEKSHVHPSPHKDPTDDGMSATEMLKTLAHEGGKGAEVGKDAPWVDRAELVKEGGGKSWRRVGVRNVQMEVVGRRLEELSGVRDEVVSRGWRYTVVQRFGEEALGEHLFSELLFPPHEHGHGHGHGQSLQGKEKKGEGLKLQIEALVKVLTTPGAWVDLSLPRERLLFVQSLYSQDSGDERRWGLVQLLLAVELVIRLDAALRLGVAQHSDEINVSGAEIHHFNKLRNLKVDWDLVVARRFLDLCYVRAGSSSSSSAEPPANPQAAGTGATTEASSSLPSPPSEKQEGHLLSKLKTSLHLGHTTASTSTSTSTSPPTDNNTTTTKTAAAPAPPPTTTPTILPRHPTLQATALLTFATAINWPPTLLSHLTSSLTTKLISPTSPTTRLALLSQTTPSGIQHPHVARHTRDFSAVGLVEAGEGTLGGPLSHAWFGGLVLPGFVGCDLLVCALLEGSRGLVGEGGRLGRVGYTRGGFVLNGAEQRGSWWCKLSVVGAVIAGAKGVGEGMGWVGVLAGEGCGVEVVDEKGGEVREGWKLCRSQQVRVMREGKRIFDGEKVARESSTLGVGKGNVLAKEFRMVTDDGMFEGLESACMSDVKLVLQEVKEEKSEAGEEKEKGVEHLYDAAVRVTIVKEEASRTKLLPLRYSVRFVSGHPCRPPHGHTRRRSSAAAAGEEDEEQHKHDHQHLAHLQAHPLHESFKYSPRSIEDVIDLGLEDEMTLPNPVDKEASPVWVVDARGGWEQEVLVRAWCASVGRHAIISKVGQSCLGCAVREARALEVGVVIRVGGRGV